MQVTPHGLALNKDDNSNDQIRVLNNETPSFLRAFRYLKLENDSSLFNREDHFFGLFF